MVGHWVSGRGEVGLSLNGGTGGQTFPRSPRTFHWISSPPQAATFSDSLWSYTKFNDPPLVLPSLPNILQVDFIPQHFTPLQKALPPWTGRFHQNIRP